MSDLVRNPNCWFCHAQAHFFVVVGRKLLIDHLITGKQFNSILYSDCQIHFSASTKHVIKGHQTITNYTLNLGGFDSANWPTRM